MKRILVDVKDFSAGSVTVKAVGGNEIIIQGVVEQKSSSSSSGPTSSPSGLTSSSSGPTSYTTRTESSSRRFEQRLMFQDLQTEGLTSSVSPDGVLTVIAPRKRNTTAAIEGTSASNQEQLQQQKQVQQLLQQKHVQQHHEQQLLQQTQAQQHQEQQLEQQQKQASDAGREHIVPIEVEGQTSTTNLSHILAPSASVQTSGISKHSTTTSQSQTTSHDNSTILEKRMTNVPINVGGFGNSLIPITPRGSFFKDSFFDTSRSHFERAVDSVFRRLASPPGIQDPLNWYTQQRSSLLQDDCRAAVVTSEGNAYKIVLDVKNFEEGTVNIRAVGDSELLVEASVDKTTGTSTTKRRYRQRFVTPGPVVSEAVTSALSEDGVLTITAPKKEATFQITELSSTAGSQRDTSVLSTSGSTLGDVSIAASTVTSPTPTDMTGPFEPVFSKITEDKNSTSSKMETMNANRQSYTQQSSTQTQTCAELRERDVSCTSDISNVSSMHTGDTSNHEKLVKINYIDQNQSEIDEANRRVVPNQFQLIGDVKDLTDYNVKESLKQRKSSSNTSQSLNKLISYENPSIFEFPIIRRGPFYQDSFFSTVHDHFQSAVRQVLDRWVEVPSLLFDGSRNVSRMGDFGRFHKTFSNYRSILDDDIFDDFACYKSLRHLNVKQENQAATVRETENDFKIVLDVHGFTEHDITIRATAHNELVVEGKVEEKTHGSVRSSSFRRQFLLPSPIKLEAVYSALSADDILTITVPKNKALSITHVTQ
ncbi:hypothetical protein HAZT_HAZT001319 [Hyalella azteca]|uniref:SHSP domain-containing protein n=1 Tax=Hyalella azteca TaxID=294128 RepID=A0A6A0GZZ0_HYAAZ|nr:hypothetical protein HAZT_HAZT001319 [Hyalella azteca]